MPDTGVKVAPPPVLPPTEAPAGAAGFKSNVSPFLFDILDELRVTTFDSLKQIYIEIIEGYQSMPFQQVICFKMK
jgi:hypothetical protein